MHLLNSAAIIFWQSDANLSYTYAKNYVKVRWEHAQGKYLRKISIENNERTLITNDQWQMTIVHFSVPQLLRCWSFNTCPLITIKKTAEIMGNWPKVGSISH